MSSEISTIYSRWWYTEYADDIIVHLKEKELTRVEFQYKSPQIDYRCNLMEFIKCNAEKLNLSRTSVHLAVYFLDIFMDNHRIRPNRLQMVSGVCLLMASKIEDRDPKIPKFSAINNLLDMPQPISDFFFLESMILNYMEWEVIVPTAATFLEYYILAAVTERDYFEFAQDNRNLLNCNIRDYNDFKLLVIELAFEFLDVSLMDCAFLYTHLPSVIACACIAAARSTMQLNNWSSELIQFTRYQLTDIDECRIKLILINSTQHGYNDIDNSTNNKRKITSDSGYLSEYNSTSPGSDNSVLVTPKKKKFDSGIV